MSLLLDALRRAGNARGDDLTEPLDQRRAADAGGAGRAEADEFDLDIDVGTAAETSKASGAKAAGDLNGPARAEAVFRGGGSGGSVLRSAALFALGTFALLGAALVGGWYYYESTRSAVDRELVRYTPDPAPANERSTAAGEADPSADEALVPGALDAQESASPDPERADTPVSGTSGADTSDGPLDRAAADKTLQSGSAAGGADDGTNTSGGSVSASRGATAGDAGTAAADARSTSEGSASGADSAEADSNHGTPDPSQSDQSATTTAAAAPSDNGTSNNNNVQADAETAASPMVRRTSSGDGRSPLVQALQDGYRALRSGDIMTARRHYRRAVELDPSNRDARLGAAAVAQRQGNAAAAIEHYRRVLADHPRDPYARSGLASLESTADPRQIESELKTLLKQDPNAHALRYALGNLYARENRWSQAQSAYFEAFRAAPNEADYAFNLAVALDQLGQRESAVAYYGEALDLAGDGSASFPLESARRRLESLRQ